MTTSNSFSFIIQLPISSHVFFFLYCTHCIPSFTSSFYLTMNLIPVTCINIVLLAFFRRYVQTRNYIYFLETHVTSLLLLIFYFFVWFAAMSQVEECQSTPALLETGIQPQVSSTSLGMIAEHGLLESCTRLSVSLEQNGLFQVIENVKRCILNYSV